MKILFAAIAVIAVGACAPAGSFKGDPKYVWVGPHCVDEANNPAADGSVAFGPLGTKTKVLLFKQVSKDGTAGEVQQPPC